MSSSLCLPLPKCVIQKVETTNLRPKLSNGSCTKFLEMVFPMVHKHLAGYEIDEISVNIYYMYWIVIIRPTLFILKIKYRFC